MQHALSTSPLDSAHVFPSSIRLLGALTAPLMAYGLLLDPTNLHGIFPSLHGPWRTVLLGIVWLLFLAVIVFGALSPFFRTVISDTTISHTIFGWPYSSLRFSSIHSTLSCGRAPGLYGTAQIRFRLVGGGTRQFLAEQRFLHSFRKLADSLAARPTTP